MRFRSRTRAPRARPRALKWAAACDARTQALGTGDETFAHYNTLILAPDVGPGAGQVIEADNVTITRIVGTIRWDAVPNFETNGDVMGWRFNYGILKMSEPRDDQIVLSLESQDDLATFDWLHVRHYQPISAEEFTPSKYLDMGQAQPIDIRVQRKFGQQDSLVLYAEANAQLLAGTDSLTVSYRWDLRILLRMA